MFPTPDYPSKFTPDYWTLVGQWLEDVGGSYLRLTENTEAFPADADDLTTHLWSEIRISTTGYESWSRRFGMSTEDLDTRVRDKAAYLLSTFEKAVPRGRFKRAFTTDECRRGGQRGKRSSKLLEAMRALPEGLTAPEIAAELDCSVRQVHRLREQLRSEQDPTNVLIAQLEAEIKNQPPVERDETEPQPTEFDYLLDVESKVPAAPQARPQAPVIDIATRRPLDPLREAIEEIERENARRPYEHMDAFLEGIAL